MGGTATPLAQPPPISFPTQVDLVTVDVVVLDGQGRPVRGLAREDFVVEEEGQPREIVSFEPFVLEATPAPQPASVVASNEAPPARSGRVFAIVLDDLGMSIRDAADGRKAVEAFLERSLRDGDDVTVATTSGDAWWSARLPEAREDLSAIFRRLRGRRSETEGAFEVMTDYEAFVIASREGPTLDRVMRRWIASNDCPSTGSGAIEEACRALVRGRAAARDSLRRRSTHAVLATVRRAAASLAALRGRKSLLLFSRGFLEDSATDVRDVAALARESNTAIYFVDVRGLVALPGMASAAQAGPAPDANDLGSMAFEERVLESAGSGSLADETGGFSVRNTNDLASGADRIAEESRIFYLLGFHPPAGPAEGRWRKLKVSVRREGLTVRARRGYSLRTAATEGAGKAERRDKPPVEVARALDSAHDAGAIPLRAMAYVFEPRGKGTTRVLIAAEFDADRLDFQPSGNARVARLDLSVAATGRDNGQSWRADQRLEVRVAEGEAAGWRGWAREFDLPSGVAQARVVVRDPKSGALGSVMHRFEVPPPGLLRLATPVLTNRLDPASRADRPRPALAVHRVFPPEGQLFCQLEVLGAARGPGRGGPRVSAGLELRAVDGRVLRKAAATPIAPDPDGRLVRVMGIGLSDLPEGAYELVLQVHDEIAGRGIERREAFSLSRQTPRLSRADLTAPVHHVE